MDAYIISYFGTNAKARLQRQAYHFQQINCLLQQSGIDQIYILAMDYNHEYVSLLDNAWSYIHPRVTYFYEARMPASQARNYLLEKFYATDNDWAMICDNDTVIDKRFDGTDIINIMDRNVDTLNKHCDMIMPVSPRHIPFNKYIKDNQDLLKDNCPITSFNYMKSSLFWIKNFQKTDGEPIYFDGTLNEQEDYEFVPRLLSKNKNIHMFKTVIMYEFALATDASVMFNANDGDNTENKRERSDSVGPIRRMIYNRYKDAGAQCTAIFESKVDDEVVCLDFGNNAEEEIPDSAFMKLKWTNLRDKKASKIMYLPKVEHPKFGNGLFET